MDIQPQIPKLVNPQGQPINADPKDMESLYQSGKAGFVPGQQIPVVSPAGEAGSVASEDIDKALQAGYKLEQPEDQISRLQKAQYSGQTARTGAEAVARGATLGASDWMMKNLGVPAEDIKGRQAAHPFLSEVGQLGGFVAPTILEGGANLFAKAGMEGTETALKIAAKGLPTNWVTEAGKAVSEAVPEFSGAAGQSLAQRIAAKAIENGAGSAIEGALIGAGNKINEDIFDDHELSAESILSNAGLGFALGGGAGLALKGIETALPKVIEGAKSSYEKLGNYLQPIQDFAKDTVASTMAKTSGTDAGVIKEFMDSPELRHYADMNPTEKEKYITGFQKTLQDSSDKLLEAQKDTFKYNKPEEIQKYLKNVDMAPALDKATSFVKETQDIINEMKSDKDLYIATPRIRLAEKQFNVLKNELAAPSNTAQIFNAIDNFKKGLDDDKILGFNKEFDRLDATTVDKIKEIRGMARDNLESPDVYGAMGARQASLNEKASAFYNVLGKEFKDEMKNFGKKTTKDGMTYFEFDPVKMRTFTNKLGVKGESQEGVDWLNNYFSKYKDYVDEMGETAKESTRGLDVEGINKQLDKTKEESSDYIKRFEAKGKLKSIDTNEGESLLGHGAVGTAAHMLDLPMLPLQIGYTLYSSAKNPAELINALKIIDKARNGAGKAIEGAVNGFLKASQSNSIKDLVPKIGAYKTTEEKYKKDSDQFKKLAADPQALLNNVTNKLRPLSNTAPQTAQALTNKTINAAQFLYGKMPKKPMTGNLLAGGEKNWRPSDVEMSKFNRYLDAANHPMSVLKDLENGSITHEQVDTLKQVYPKLYSQIAQKVTDKISSMREDLPYSKRLQLGILFGIPTDSSMHPDFIASMQGSHMQAQAEDAQRKVRASAKLKKSENVESDTESVINRA